MTTKLWISCKCLIFGLHVGIWFLQGTLAQAGFVVRVGQGFGGTIGYSDRPETQNNYLLTG